MEKELAIRWLIVLVCPFALSYLSWVGGKKRNDGESQGLDRSAHKSVQE